MSFWTLGQFSEITAGRWLVEPPDANAALSGVDIDSRAIGPGEAFVAIAGERFDGHQFVERAFAAGAALAIVSQAPAQCSQPVLVVDDTVVALQQLARAYREVLVQNGCRLIAVAGSNGKTTTRHLIHTILAGQYRGTQSPRSFNNHLGVPLTILGAREGDDFLVAEVGTNHPGEIAFLGDMLQPNIAVITNIGKEHLAFFDGVQGVAREESAILDCAAPGGLAVIEPRAAELIFSLRSAPKHVRISYGAAEEQPADDMPAAGAHGRSNAALALAVAAEMGVTWDQARLAMRSFKGLPGRWEVLRFEQQVVVIHDAYNANPDSFSAALDSFKAMRASEKSKRTILVAADMLELGEAAESEHRALGTQIGQLQQTGELDGVVLIGPMMSSFVASAIAGAGATAPWLLFKDWSDDLPQALAERVQPGDAVLLKGSRSMALERLIPAIEARYPLRLCETNDSIELRPSRPK